jgi:predicted RNA-binding Zn-ribbon protein involved in translation (DUF1610 family)
MFKDVPAQDAVCSRCGQASRTPGRLNLLTGFTTFVCPHCGRKSLLPLSRQRRIVYITLSAIFAVLWIVATVAKGLGGPGLIPLALWLAVAKDAHLGPRSLADPAQSPGHPGSGAGDHPRPGLRRVR